MLKKSKKNPTFNELFPQEIIIDGYDQYYMFDYVFSDSELNGKVFTVFAPNVDEIDVKFSFEIDFRALYGEREVDDTIINNPFSNYFLDDNLGYEYLKFIMLRYQYKWNKLIDNVYAQTYNPIENYDRQEDTSLTY